MQNFIAVVELKALGVCPCTILLLWQNWRRWTCAHAKFITVGRTQGVGRVPMQNFIALAELKALGVCPSRIYCHGTAGGIGRVPMQNFIAFVELKALDVCPCTILLLW